MLVRRAHVPESLQPESLGLWPYTVPCVRELVEHGLEFTAPVTFLVGENGSGKSTVIEAIAEAFKLDAYGGRAGRRLPAPPHAMNLTEADRQYRAWMRELLGRAANEFALALDGPATFGWLDRSISAPAHAGNHRYWLRVVTERPDWACGDTWTGNADANDLPDWPLPRVMRVQEWRDNAHRHVRAEHMTRLPGEPCSTQPEPPPGLALPDTWWNTLTGLVHELSGIATSRVNADQARVDQRIAAAFGDQPRLRIERWETVHGDLHWANLLHDPFGLADWELWGRGPAGTDAATLYLYSLARLPVAQAVHGHFADILDSTDGRKAQLYVAARLLHRAQHFGETPGLVQPVTNLGGHLLEDSSVVD